MAARSHARLQLIKTCLDGFDKLRADGGLLELIGHEAPSSAAARTFRYGFHNEENLVVTARARAAGTDQKPATMLRQSLVFICRDPLMTVAGDVVYVRAHARLAFEAGFEPHIFCAARRNEIVKTEYGVVHRVWSPFRPFRAVAMPLHAPLISRAISRFLLSTGQPFLIHGFGAWVYAGARARRKLRAVGMNGILISTTYDVHLREARARLAGAAPPHGRLHRWQNYLEFLWTRAVVAPCERHGYADSKLVIVNYDSVRRSLLQGYVESERVRILPYSTESAVLHGVEAVSAREPSSDPPLLVAVSRHDARKGVDILLRSTAELFRRNVGDCADYRGSRGVGEVAFVLAVGDSLTEAMPKSISLAYSCSLRW